MTYGVYILQNKNVFFRRTFNNFALTCHRRKSNCKNNFTTSSMYLLLCPRNKSGRKTFFFPVNSSHVLLFHLQCLSLGLLKPFKFSSFSKYENFLGVNFGDFGGFSDCPFELLSLQPMKSSNVFDEYCGSSFSDSSPE